MGILKTKNIIMLLAAGIFMLSCATQKRLKDLNEEAVGAALSLSSEDAGDPEEWNDVPEVQKRDTIQIEDFDGKEVLIMRAVKDENGEMVATDVLDAATVTARFRNVAERRGKVDIVFRITVPEKMQYEDWQLRFFPIMHILEDTVALSPVIITGMGYREEQLKGYQRYNRFLSSIVSDTTYFVNMRLLEIFIKRNIPELYAFRNDTSFVTESEFRSAFGVSGEEAVWHYTNKIGLRINNKRISRKDDMFRKYVKAPIISEGIKLDTVIRSVNGDFIYDYVQTVDTRPKLRKVEVVLGGEVYKSDQSLYSMPESEPLTFYISSLSTLTDNTVRYIKKILERRVEANTVCYIDFDLASYEVVDTFANNDEEIHRIKENLASLMENKEFDLDSVVVTASASPEGRRSYNETLSRNRAQAIGKYFGDWMKSYTDSLEAVSGFSVDEYGNVQNIERNIIPMISYSGGENWNMLDAIVKADTVMTAAEKEQYFSGRDSLDADLQEARMREFASYDHIRNSMYPKLRTVRFDFHLHRKGMVKDTVHTTVPDSVYMEGVQAIRDRDYEKAISMLRPYGDYNTAVAYMSLDYNASAKDILEKLEKDDRVSYMLAILYGRLGDDAKAVEYYIRACRMNPAMVHRGNLDPEIAALKKRYSIDEQLQTDEEPLL